MASNPVDLYPLIAQITAAFAGFASLASGLGQRRGGDDMRLDAYRLRSILLTSLSATFFGLLPATAMALVGDEQRGIHYAAITVIAIMLVVTPPSLVQAYRIRHAKGLSWPHTLLNRMAIAAAFISFVLCAVGWPAGRSAGLFLLGLMCLMSSTIMLFSRVIVSALRPYQNASEEGCADPPPRVSRTRKRRSQ